MSMEHENEPKEHSTKGQAEQQEPGQLGEFSFLQEKIKEKPINKKQLVMNIGKLVSKGIVFGLAACLGFFALKPWAEDTFHQNPQEVTIPKDEEQQADTEAEVVDEQPAAPVLTIDNYKELNQVLYQIATEADKSMVEVKGILADTEWIKKGYDLVNSVSGLIVADNGQDLLVLIKSNVLKDAQSIEVIFNDGYTCPGLVKMTDATLNLAVVSVSRAAVRESTLNMIRVAILGNSNVLRRGESVIALGKPFGYAGGMSTGMISSIKNEIVLTDGKYALVSTDIPGTADGTGVLFNISGEVIGFIDQSVSEQKNRTVTTGISISNIKKEIELLSNGIAVPYLGVLGNEVTKSISESQGIPIGVYVKEVEADSPAMKAGIQNGDVITMIGEEKIATLSNHYNALLSHKVGDTIKIVGQRRGASGYVEISYEAAIGSKE